MVQGLGFFHPAWDRTWSRCFDDTQSYVWDPAAVDAAFSWMASQGLSFARFQMNLVLARDDATYRSHITDILNIADKYGVYVMFCPVGLSHPDSGYEMFAWRTNTQPYTPYLQSYEDINTTARFNAAMASLAALCAGHKNAILEIWNEPTFGGYNSFNRAAYENYNANVHGTLQAIRSAGFTGLVYVMSGGPNFWTDDYSDEGNVRPDATMKCAIDNLGWFKNYGRVAFDWHNYFLLQLNPDNLQPWHWPENIVQLEALWMVEGRIAEAQNLGIQVGIFETGIFYSDPTGGFTGTPGAPLDQTLINRQLEQLANALEICNINNMDWCVHTGERGDISSVVSSAWVWNSAGQVLINYVVLPTLSLRRLIAPLASIAAGVGLIFVK